MPTKTKEPKHKTPQERIAELREKIQASEDALAQTQVQRRVIQMEAQRELSALVQEIAALTEDRAALKDEEREGFITAEDHKKRDAAMKDALAAKEAELETRRLPFTKRAGIEEKDAERLQKDIDRLKARIRIIQAGNDLSEDEE